MGNEYYKAQAVKRPLDRLVMWLNWPKKPWNCLVPWYAVVWRLLWLPVLFPALWFSWLAIAIAYGPGKAMQFWRNAT